MAASGSRLPIAYIEPFQSYIKQQRLLIQDLKRKIDHHESDPAMGSLFSSLALFRVFVDSFGVECATLIYTL